MVAVHIIIAVIPIVGIIMGSVLIFFYFLWRHKQIIRQIDIIRDYANGYRLCIIRLIFSYCRGELCFAWRAYPISAWH